ncbi:peptidoglycan DD-metalloendopeptidase family protein [Luteipulveratus halotolerans]|uniref:peptidoglycan DD-metalloendopeptidase family protein n=1 Tax=Luteipulveratus halotolerans TaxID=1631356 RepID=UPI0012F8C932|nr:peptidoglycan DD-metalloendopeptidase family protein [Luteipulveratus halotolerans]
MATPALLASVGSAVVIPRALADKKDSAPDTTCQVISADGTWRSPLTQTYAISSRFGERFHPIDKVNRLHAGVDLVSAPQQKQVVAASNGVVVRVGAYGGLGTAVTIRHKGGITTTYGHLASIADGLRRGDKVSGGQVLGLEGSSGKATGDHLHFEVRVNGVATDPIPFMRQHGAPLNGDVTGPGAGGKDGKGGVVTGTPLPKPGLPRKHTLKTQAMAIPQDVKRLYVAAGQAYDIPWTLLAGIGMEETLHGRVDATSYAGAKGLMQFMPSTWALMGVDGDGDGRADISNDADSAMSAANYLTRSGVRKGAEGVRRALFAYNHADWYVNDVLAYADQYAGGAGACVPGGADGLSSMVDPAVEPVLTWAQEHVGDAHQLGAVGPRTWDASSYTQHAYHQIDVQMPRTAAQQRDWLAQGHGSRVIPGREQPGDLIFTDSYRGPNAVGDVAIVLNPVEKSTLEAKDPASGVITGSYATTEAQSHIFEIWRPNRPATQAEPKTATKTSKRHSSERHSSERRDRGSDRSRDQRDDKKSTEPRTHSSKKSSEHRARRD